MRRNNSRTIGVENPNRTLRAQYRSTLQFKVVLCSLRIPFVSLTGGCGTARLITMDAPNATCSATNSNSSSVNEPTSLNPITSIVYDYTPLEFLISFWQKGSARSLKLKTMLRCKCAKAPYEYSMYYYITIPRLLLGMGKVGLSMLLCTDNEQQQLLEEQKKTCEHQ